MEFPFGQVPETKDCGFRCLYYVVSPATSYQEWLKTLKHNTPEQSGLPMNNIITHLRGENFDIEQAVISDHGLFVVYSSSWLTTSGHYLVYHDGVAYDSVDTCPRPYSLEDFKARSKVWSGLKISKRSV